MFDGVTLASLMTAAGAGIAGTIVTLTVSVLKTGVKPIASWDGMTFALGLSALLYVLVGLATVSGADFVTVLNEGFGVFLAWLTCAASALGVHKAVVAPLLDRANGGGSGG